MQVTRTSRIRIRLQNIVFVGLFLAVLGLLAWLSTRYVFQADWTAGGRNTLSEGSVKLLQRMEGPIRITAFAREDEALRGHIKDVVERYQRAKADVMLSFVNPDAEPQRVRDLGITLDGELLVEYQGRQEKIQDLSEQSLSNALQRVALSGERWIVFLEGHGERAPKGQANHDLGEWVRELERSGLKTQRINLAKNPAIPDNTAVLVIAGPQVDLLPGEATLIQQYLDKGGNLFWLGEPGGLHGLETVAEMLGVSFLPGTVVDATTQLFGIQNPAFALVAEYPPHPILRDFAAVTLFPMASALELDDGGDWQSTPLLRTLPRSWSETGEIEGEIRFDEGTGERAGPLTIGVALTRTFDRPESEAGQNAEQTVEDTGPGEDSEGREQRVVVIGDGDFLSNAYLGNGANLDLGLNIIRWLTRDEQFIDIRVKPAPDLTLTLSNTASAVIGIGFLFVVPLALLAGGITIWYRRRRR
jgi:ABC-type uncharacterized transport system involved in gliding motility auxiliary subunit